MLSLAVQGTGTIRPSQRGAVPSTWTHGVSDRDIQSKQNIDKGARAWPAVCR